MRHRPPTHTRSTHDKHEGRPRRTAAAYGGLALAISMLIAVTLIPNAEKAAAGTSAAARVGDPAPDFTLQLLNGKSVTLSSLKGKPVVVNFWNSG